MSQEKVDKYKESKKNRKKIMAKEKRSRVLSWVLGLVICLAVAAGLVIMVYAMYHSGNSSSNNINTDNAVFSNSAVITDSQGNEYEVVTGSDGSQSIQPVSSIS